MGHEHRGPGRREPPDMAGSQGQQKRGRERWDGGPARGCHSPLDVSRPTHHQREEPPSVSVSPPGGRARLTRPRAQRGRRLAGSPRDPLKGGAPKPQKGFPTPCRTAHHKRGERRTRLVPSATTARQPHHYPQGCLTGPAPPPGSRPGTPGPPPAAPTQGRYPPPPHGRRGPAARNRCHRRSARRPQGPPCAPGRPASR